jgi:hypothetical protein
MRLDQPFDPDQAPAPEAEPTPAAAKKPAMDPFYSSMLLMAALAGGGLWFMHKRTALPAEDALQPSAAQTRVASFMSGGQSQLAQIEKALRDTNQLIDSLRVKPAERLAASRIDAYAGAGDPFQYTPLTASDDANAAKPDVPAVADATREARELAKQKAFDDAKKLRLQSIMAGSARHACMIDAKLYFEGQTVQQFVVEKITRDEVIVRRGEFSFRLRMSR